MQQHIPTRQQTIIEQRNKNGSIINRYIKGKYLGKGGFAKCYQFTHIGSGQKYAAKIIQKATLTRAKAKQKLASQIEIHRSVVSQFVVKYQRHFQDTNNVYIILQLCTNQTLNELIKRRKRITEIQARYYFKQIALAIKDFQTQMIIHRDLKLGNLLLTQNLQIRISDFGLAAKLSHPGQRRKTMCGTPNYIAPQILQNGNLNGHSYEVDIWSLGVIAYACLVGRPPFETNEVKATYAKIKMCNYSFPDNVNLSIVSKNFISKMLQRDPRHRITIEQTLNDQFFNLPIPEALPTTLLACPPSKVFLDKYSCGPSITQLHHRESSESQKTQVQTGRTLIRTNSIQQFSKPNYCQRAASSTALQRGRMPSSSRPDYQKPIVTNNVVSKGQLVWVTYFEQNPKFGMAYLLNSNSIGMKFNDSTCLISNNQYSKMKYIDFLSKTQSNKQDLFDVSLVPEKLTKKYKIISYYLKQLKSKKQSLQKQLTNQQIIAKQRNKYKQTSENALTIWVTRHSKTTKANLFWFNNKDYQIIFQDFTQLLFSKQNITYVNKLGERIYFKKQSIQSQNQQIKKRYKYTANIIQTMTDNNKNQQPSNIPSQNPSLLGNIKTSRDSNSNKENRPEEAQNPNLVRSSSVYKLQKPSTHGVLLRGSASTSRIPSNPRILKY